MSPSRLCDEMAQKNFKHFFVPQINGEQESINAVACLLKSGFVLKEEHITIDVRYVDGENCTVTPNGSQSEGSSSNNNSSSSDGSDSHSANRDCSLRAIEPTMEEVDRADRRNPLLHGADLAERVSNMVYDWKTGRISLITAPPLPITAPILSL